MNRRVELDGPGNFRDLGGLPVAGGGSTRTGLVYRADRLCTLSDADLRRLEAAGIRHVFDLRSEAEVSEFPDRLPAGASYVRLPMTSGETFRTRTTYERIVDREIKSYGEPEMVAGYARILNNFAPSFVRIARQVGRGEPLVVHCTAGKDRTGVASMLLLDLAGVAAEHVAADYALSSERRPSLQRDTPKPGRSVRCSRTWASILPGSLPCGKPAPPSSPPPLRSCATAGAARPATSRLRALATPTSTPLGPACEPEPEEAER